LLFQRPLRTDKPALIPGPEFVKGGIHRRVPHRSFPSGGIGESRVRKPGEPAVRKCGSSAVDDAKRAAGFGRCLVVSDRPLLGHGVCVRHDHILADSSRFRCVATI
jgi:hypothetical protein